MHCGLREVIQQTDSIYIASSSVLAELFFFDHYSRIRPKLTDSLVTLMKMGTKGKRRKYFRSNLDRKWSIT